MSLLRIHLFGGLALFWEDQPLPPIPSAAARSLLAYLVTYRDRPHTRDLIAGTFWPELPDAVARRRLSQALWQIRHALRQVYPERGRRVYPERSRRAQDDALSPHPVLLTEGDAVQFNPDLPIELDVEQFTMHYAQCAESTPEALGHCELCVKHYRGDFLAGYYDDWALVERERLREVFLTVLERLVNGLKVRGAYEGALVYARRLAAEDPLREAAHREVMRLCHLLGRDNEALQQYQVCRRVLADELGVEPSVETGALAAEIATRSGLPEPPWLPAAARRATAPLLERPDRLPLVGRQPELAELLHQVDAAAGGNGGLTLIYGEAGVGKTRLLQEVARNAQWRGVQVVWGRCYELAAPPVYQPLIEALRAGLPALNESALEPVWRAELSRLLPELATGEELPPSLQPEERRRRLLEAITRAFLALADVAPHLVLLEDGHWMDAASLEALRYLLPRLAETLLLIVVTARIEELVGQPAAILAGLESTRLPCRLDLGRLNLAETEELVRRALDLEQPAPRFSARLYAETEGNPFFLIETLWALADEGLLYRDEAGAWSTPWDESTEDYAELPLPVGVVQSIERRLDRLPAPLRELLNLAAVIGRGVVFELWHQASDRAEEELLAAGDTLCARGLLLAADPDATAGADYLFTHDQIRRVTYDRLTAPRRRFYHRRVAESLTHLAPDEPEPLAYHWTQAGVWDKAVAYNRQAGGRARAVYAGAEALGYFDRALGAWERLRLPDESLGLSLYEQRGRICQETGRFDQAETDFQAAYRFAEQVGDQVGLARILNHLSYLQFQRGDFSGAAEVAQQALDLATAAGLSSEIAAGLFNVANATRNLGHYQTAIRFYKRAVAMYQELDDQVRLADSLNRMGYALLLAGAYARAHSVMERSLTIRRRLDDRVGISYSLINLAALHYCQGQFARTRKAAQEALEVANAIGDPYGEDIALHDLGLAALEQGSPTQAIPFFQRALRIAREIGDRALEPEALSELGRAYHHLGDLERAQETLEQSLSMIPISIVQSQVPAVHAYLTQVFLAADRDDKALAHAHAGLQEAKEIKEPWSLGLTHRVMGEVAEHLGQDKTGTEPVPHFEESIRILREIGAEAELARSLAAYGLYLRRSAEVNQAQRGVALLGEARSLLKKLGMAGDLARLEAQVAARLSPGQARVRLPRAEAPTGRPLRDDEWLEVTWTVAAPEDEAIINKVARRRHQLVRLLQEANEQRAAPTVSDLAAALEVSQVTVKRDLAALRQAGHRVRTRGSRG
jgi:DNA-binding SARP family transcriptional activator